MSGILEYLADGPSVPTELTSPAMAQAASHGMAPTVTALPPMDNSRAFAPLPGEPQPCRSCRGGRGDVNVNVNVNAGNTSNSPLPPSSSGTSHSPGVGSFPGARVPGATDRPQFESPAKVVEYRPFAVPVDRIVKTVEYKPWAAVWDRIKERFTDRPVAIPVDRVRQVPLLQPKPSFEGRRS